MMLKSTTTFVLKISVADTEDIRRFRLPGAPSFESLTKLIRENYGAEYVARYQDDEGDWCLLLESTFQDFLELIKDSSVGRIQLTPESKAPKKANVVASPVSSDPLPVPNFPQEYHSACGPKPFLIGLAQLAASDGWKPETITTLALCHLPTIRQRIKRKAERLNHIDNSALARLRPSLLAFADTAGDFMKEGEELAMLAREVADGSRGLGTFLTELMQWLGRHSFSTQSQVLEHAVEQLLRSNSDVFLQAFDVQAGVQHAPLQEDVEEGSRWAASILRAADRDEADEDPDVPFGPNFQSHDSTPLSMEQAQKKVEIVKEAAQKKVETVREAARKAVQDQQEAARKAVQDAIEEHKKVCEKVKQAKIEEREAAKQRVLALKQEKDAAKQQVLALKQDKKEHDEAKKEKKLFKYTSLGVDVVKLKASDSGAILEWLVRICPRKGSSYVLLCTPKGNVKCNKDGNFSNKGGEGIWAQWEMSDVDNGLASFKNVGTSKYLAVDSSGKAMPSDTEVSLLVSVTEDGIFQQDETSATDILDVEKAKEKEKRRWYDQFDEVKLKVVDSEAILEWPVRICPLKGSTHVLLRTSKANVRSDKNGNFDNNGGGGIWAQWEMMVSAHSGSTSFKHAGTGKYLAVDSSGKAVISDAKVHFVMVARDGFDVQEPEELSTKDASKDATAKENDKSSRLDVDDVVKLKGYCQTTCSEVTLEWPVCICPKGSSHVLLRTPNGNVRSDKDGNFSDKGGEGIWAQWEMGEIDGGFISFKHAGTGKYLAVDSSGKAMLSDAEGCFSAIVAKDGFDVQEPEKLSAKDASKEEKPKEKDKKNFRLDADDVVKLKALDSQGTLEWPVRICICPNRSSHVLLRNVLPQSRGNVKCDKDGNFSDTGGEGIWAQWEMGDIHGFAISLKHAGTGKYLAVDSSGKAMLSDAENCFEVLVTEDGVDFAIRNEMLENNSWEVLESNA